MRVSLGSYPYPRLTEPAILAAAVSSSLSDDFV